MSKIVVGVDGSEQAQSALEWAVGEAKLRGASVHVVYAYLPRFSDVYTYPEIMTPEQWEQLSEQSRREAEDVLEEALGKLGSQADGLDITSETATGESPPKALVERSEDAELLVVGSRGRGGFAGMLLGSVSQQVAQHATCPVVIIGARA